jgi:MFS family permease
LISSNFSEDKTKYYGYLESFIGIGLIAGPPIGSLAYDFFGYDWAFYVFAIPFFV